MALGQSLQTALKLRKRDWSKPAEIAAAFTDIQRWSQTIPVTAVGFRTTRILANDALVANGADTAVIFNYAPEDAEGFTTACINTAIAAIVPPGRGGWYTLNAGVRYTANIAGTVFLTITVTRNGATFGIGMEELQSGQSRGTVDAQYQLQPGDQLKVFTVNRSGAGVTPLYNAATANTPAYPWFACYRTGMLPKLINS